MSIWEQWYTYYSLEHQDTKLCLRCAWKERKQVTNSIIVLQVKGVEEGTKNDYLKCHFKITLRDFCWLLMLFIQTFCFTFKLTFMEQCIARSVFYITNEMQLIQCSLLLSALYMFRAVFPPIIRSLKNCTCSLGYFHAFLLSTAGVDELEHFIFISR